MVGLIEIPTTSRGRRPRTDQRVSKSRDRWSRRISVRCGTAPTSAKAAHDANWDTTALVGYDAASGTWNLVQRYVYSPYGSLTILNADFSTPATSFIANIINSVNLSLRFGVEQDFGSSSHGLRSPGSSFPGATVSADLVETQ